jgi:hypothetical protein
LAADIIIEEFVFSATDEGYIRFNTLVKEKQDRAKQAIAIFNLPML